MFSYGHAGQLIRLRCLFDPRLSLLIFVIGYTILAHAQEDEPKPCTHVRLTETAVVRGYVFHAYEGKTPDDPGCVRVYRRGKLVFQLAEDEQYHLGQPADPANNIPPVSNGTDLAGSGRPDMIVTSWSGGAHCCFSHYVFELEPEFRLLATIKDGDADLAHFEDLDHDQHYYYLTSEIWSYWPSSFASSVSHKVVLKWNGEKFVLDLDRMRNPPPNPQQWQAALKDVDDALKDGGDVRGALGVTLWDTTLDLIYTGHSDLAWKFVREADPNAFQGDNPSLEEFCSMLKESAYWSVLGSTLKDMPDECARAKPRK